MQLRSKELRRGWKRKEERFKAQQKEQAALKPGQAPAAAPKKK